MDTLGEAIGASVEPAIIAISTATILGLLRLVTPTVRWSRRLKNDAEVYGALPHGREKDLWEARVIAQAERLRLYRENLSLADQIFAWGSFALLVLVVFTTATEASNGWPSIRAFTPEEALASIPFAVIAVMNIVFCITIVVQLIRGQSTRATVGGGGHYPKYVALRRAERRRHELQTRIERRTNVVASHADRERRERSRAKRRALKAK